ncbi:two-component system sensor kinase [Collimonas arenae]|uniref:Two-component system sensor kinase n=1 Tax=Collimonas arenae TaxID=279058 RepID=A0A0A1FJ95_9BURK|nr:histidine kinase [Collimonas arenae]AIY42972.1 two-component system sensor kinase [Collimonas arenae]
MSWRGNIKPADGLAIKNEIALSFATDAADALMVARMRLVLAISVLLAIFIDPSGLSGVDHFTWLVFSGYVLHSIALYIFSQFSKSFAQGKLIHWLDVCWYAAIVLFTGGINSFFFLFFFFAILTSSFRWGFEEGARITIVSAILLAACSMVSEAGQDLPRLLLRTTFLLTFGYMSARWGESKVELKRRLALLRDVSRLSNPRFGVDHTVTSILKKTLTFFKGSSCILVVRDKDSAAYSLRTIKEGDVKQSVTAVEVRAEAASRLMALSPDHAVAYTRPLWSAMSLLGGSLAYDSAKGKWIRQEEQTCQNLAELLEADSFISVPLSLRKGDGRIYVVSQANRFSKADALFLSHITEQAFPVIENIELLDHMASEAVSQERKKIALDIHDTAIQPYIGLKMGLSAVRNKAAADNPLIDDLDKLTAMAAQVIGDLRRYAGTFKNEAGQSEPIFLVVLRQQAEQVREFYGIDIAVSMEGELNFSDRLTAEVLQVVREGLSNICKHTVAQRGFVKLQCTNGLLKIQIENEGMGAQPIEFIPRSITERATALGGNTQVRQGPGGSTAVHIEIPV